MKNEKKLIIELKKNKINHCWLILRWNFLIFRTSKMTFLLLWPHILLNFNYLVELLYV